MFTILFLYFTSSESKIIYWSNIPISIPTMRRMGKTKNGNGPIFKAKCFNLSISSSFISKIGNNKNIEDKYYYTLTVPSTDSYLAWVEDKNGKTVSHLVETDRKELKLTNDNIEDMKNGDLHFHVYYKKEELKEVVKNNYY